MKLIIANTGIHQDAEGRFSLNDLHRASGGEDRHQPALFLRSEQTKSLIAEVENSTDSQSFGTVQIRAVSTKEGRGGGSFACKELVYAYAMWISAKFHLQVIRTFDAVTTGDSGKAERIAKAGAGNTALDKLRTANALKLAEETAARICSRFANLGDSAQQLIYAKIINPIVGDEVLMLPAVREQHFTAAEVGERFGITAAMVGRIANQHSLKTPEYGEFFLDKSPHSSKQVETFRYNERGAARIGELAGAAVATAAVMNKAMPNDAAGSQLFE